MNSENRIDLSEGPILETLIKLAVPVTIRMVMFAVYLIVDLYFFVRLGAEAVASAMAAIVGQNFGAQKFSRLSGTFWRAWLISMIFLIGCTAICLLSPQILSGIFSDNSDVVHFGVLYFRIFSIGFVMVGTIMVASSAFQGLGKTYPSLVGAVVDNALFAGLVFTLPVYFSWGIQSVWWIKLATAAAETVVVIVWLRHELTNVRSNFIIARQSTELQFS